MKTMILTLIFVLATSLNASVVGSVAKIVGSVKVKSDGSIKKSKVELNQKIKEGDLITTAKKARVVINLIDGSDVVLDESSSIHFKKNNSIEQNGGKVFYKIASRDAKNSIKVKTPFAIIGIKGTTFTVNSNEGSESVALKEGKIGVTSIEEAFNLYRKEVLAKYNEYVMEQMKGFEKFKGSDKPEPEITKEFDLEAGNVISFSGKTVKESAWNDSDDAEFDVFEKMIDSNFDSFKEEESEGNIEDGRDVDFDEFDSKLSSEKKGNKKRALDAMQKSMDDF